MERAFRIFNETFGSPDLVINVATGQSPWYDVTERVARYLDKHAFGTARAEALSVGGYFTYSEADHTFWLANPEQATSELIMDRVLATQESFAPNTTCRRSGRTTRRSGRPRSAKRCTGCTCSPSPNTQNPRSTASCISRSILSETVNRSTDPGGILKACRRSEPTTARRRPNTRRSWTRTPSAEGGRSPGAGVRRPDSGGRISECPIGARDCRVRVRLPPRPSESLQRPRRVRVSLRRPEPDWR